MGAIADAAAGKPSIIWFNGAAGARSFTSRVHPAEGVEIIVSCDTLEQHDAALRMLRESVIYVHDSSEAQLNLAAGLAEERTADEHFCSDLGRRILGSMLRYKTPHWTCWSIILRLPYAGPKSYAGLLESHERRLFLGRSIAREMRSKGSPGLRLYTPWTKGSVFVDVKRLKRHVEVTIYA